MINRESLRELAEYDSPQGCALTFYYQPDTPRDQSHREQAIVVKDLVRDAMREAEKAGKNGGVRPALQRILEMADLMHGNNGRAKAIFADASQGFWREFDLPPKLMGTSLTVNRRFHLHGMAPLLEVAPTVCVCLVDRTKARLWEMKNGTIRELFGFLNPLPPRGEAQGSSDYVTDGHIERNIAEITKQHYKRVNYTLVQMYDRDGWESLVLGCRDENWPELSEVLHPYLRQNLIGRLRLDPLGTKDQTLREEVQKLLATKQATRRQDLILEAIGQAHRESRGALGLRRVLRSLEAGEIQTLLLGSGFKAQGSDCRHCSHIGLSQEATCSVCGQLATLVPDLADAIVREAVRKKIEVVFVEGDAKLEKIGHIAAVLRFRSGKKQQMEIAS